MYKLVGAIIWGALLGFIGVVFHNELQPFGLLFALLVTIVAMNFSGQLFGARKFKLLVAISWLFVVLRAGTYGLSSEILIISNPYGNIFLIGGLLLVTIATLKKV